MAHAQKTDFVFRRNGRVHLNRQGRQFSRLLATEVCASTVLMLDTPCSKAVWRALATHSILQFPLYFPFRASPCAITLQLHCITTPIVHRPSPFQHPLHDSQVDTLFLYTMTITLPSFRRVVVGGLSFQGSSFDRSGFCVGGFVAKKLTQGPYSCTSDFPVSVIKVYDNKGKW
jgi:hypothetical protein